MTTLEKLVIAWTEAHVRCAEYSEVFSDQEEYPIGESRELRTAMLTAKRKLVIAGQKLRLKRARGKSKQRRLKK